MEQILDITRTIVITVGVTIAVFTFWANSRQRALENSIRLVDMFFKSVSENDLRWFRYAFKGTAEHANVPPNQVRLPLSLNGIIVEEDLSDENSDSRSDRVYPISDLFSEGPPDQGAISRICNIVEIIAYETNRKAADSRYIYYRIGQIIDFCAELVIVADLDRKFGYPNVAKISRKWRRRSKKWPGEIHVSIE